MSHHVLDRNVLSGLRYPGYQTGVLLGEKAFWNNDEEINGQGERREEDEQRDKMESQYDVEPALITFQQCIEAAFAERVETAMMRILRRGKESRRHHRGQRQRNGCRNDDGER